MGSLMDTSHGREQEPELDQVLPRFGGEVVKLEAVGPDFSELVGPHPEHDGKQEED